MSPTRRTAAERETLMRRLGTDLALAYPGPAGWFEDADLATTRGLGARDLAVAGRLDAADQLLANRLKTQRGELAALGHPGYGSRHHELVGQPNVERTRNLVKLHVLEALRDEPRIERVLRCDVYAPHDPPREQVRIEVTVRLIGEDVPRNLVVPFSLATGDAGP